MGFNRLQDKNFGSLVKPDESHNISLAQSKLAQVNTLLNNTTIYVKRKIEREMTQNSISTL